MSSDLVTFLRARLDEDEQVARQVTMCEGDDPSLWVLDDDYKHDTLVIDSARVLAEVAAKRRMVEQCGEAAADAINYAREARDLADDTLRLLALPFSDHPDYDESWRP